ncbi:hypothetical protein NB689_002024 [Xanthomonas sacchari]|nr:hypothetical protein [Xanthomonas sacchari]
MTSVPPRRQASLDAGQKEGATRAPARTALGVNSSEGGGSAHVARSAGVAAGHPCPDLVVGQDGKPIFTKTVNIGIDRCWRHNDVGETTKRTTHAATLSPSLRRSKSSSSRHGMLRRRFPRTRTRRHQRQGHIAGHRLSGRRVATHRLARTARQSGGQRADPAQDPGDRARVELQGRQARLQPAPAQCRHPGAAVLRRPDHRRLADQPVLPLDAGLDHPRLRPPWLRPTGVVPAVVGQLARRLWR